MRQLLYIPDSKFITINIDGKEYSIEEYIKVRNNNDDYNKLTWTNGNKLTESSVIGAITSKQFSDNFYARYDLYSSYITREMFEVVDI